MDQVVLLKVSQLSEALLTQVALEGPLTAVHSQMDLIGKHIHKKMLHKSFAAQRQQLYEVSRRIFVP